MVERGYSADQDIHQSYGIVVQKLLHPTTQRLHFPKYDPQNTCQNNNHMYSVQIVVRSPRLQGMRSAATNALQSGTSNYFIFHF